MSTSFPTDQLSCAGLAPFLGRFDLHPSRAAPYARVQPEGIGVGQPLPSKSPASRGETEDEQGNQSNQAHGYKLATPAFADKRPAT